MDNREEDIIWNKEKNEGYVRNTGNREVATILKKTIRDLNPGYALELGFGAGIESAFLIKNGWKVKGIDVVKENERNVLDKISEEERKRFSFEQSRFENLKLEKNAYDLIIGFNSFHFCRQEYFKSFFEEVVDSLKSGGILICNLLGENDEWKKEGRNLNYFTKDEILELLKEDFTIGEKTIRETEEDGKKADGKIKHWHTFLIKAKKK